MDCRYAVAQIPSVRLLDGFLVSQGALISPAQSIAGIEMYDVEWILIIEKEVRRVLPLFYKKLTRFLRQAVFRSLCVAEFLDHPTFPKGVIITGKGFPDVATREFVKQLSIDLPQFVPSPSHESGVC